MEVLDGNWNINCDNCVSVKSVDSFFEGEGSGQNMNMIVMHINIRSILKNWDELMLEINSNIEKIDMLILTEVNVKKENLKGFEIDGFERFEKLREDRRGGGVIIYVKKSVYFVVLEESEKEMELLLGKFKMGEWEGIIMAVYRPPKTKIDMFLEEIEKYITRFKKYDIIFIGDMNLDINEKKDGAVDKYQNIMAENGLQKCIKGITRANILNDKKIGTCIDHIFIKAKNCMISSAIIDIAISDHYMIMAELIGEYRFGETKEREEITYIDNKIVERELKKINWDEMLIINDAEIMYNKIANTFRNIYERAKKCKMVKIGCERRDNKWMTKELIVETKQRDYLFRKCKNAPNNITYRMEYRAYRNKINKKIAKAKNSFYRNKFKDGDRNVRKKWEQINDILGKKSHLSIDEVINKHMGDKGLIKVAEEFANTFIEGVEKEKHVCYNVINGRVKEERKNDYFCFFSSDRDMIENIIKGMNERKAPGIDGIRMRDLKLVSGEISGVISKLINLTVEQGIIPNELKTAIIRPVYKGGDHTSCMNYRPIAILPAIEKIMEKYVMERLVGYLEKYEIIDKVQYGFQKGRNVNQLFTKLVDLVNSKLNDNKKVLVLFVDFTKAFDMISHDILMKKLQNIGIRGMMLGWIENYLKRFNLVKINKEQSDVYEIKTGVPQGSILGPVLYNVYVNDMKNIVQNTELMLYADDTAMVVSHREYEKAEELLQKNFNALLQWTHDNGLRINKSKTKVMFIRSPWEEEKRKVELIFHEYDCIHRGMKGNCKCKQKGFIEVTEEFKYLGLVIDCHFKWNKHIDKVCKSLRSWLFHFNQLKYMMPYDVLLEIYFAVVDSAIRYGLIAWGGASDCHIKRVEALQNRVLKQILEQHRYGGKENDIKESNFRICGVMSVQNLYDYLTIVDNYNSKTFKINVENVKGTRYGEKNKYIVPRYNNRYGKNELRCRIPRVFNEIPVEYKNIEGMGFRKSIKDWLIYDRN